MNMFLRNSYNKRHVNFASLEIKSFHHIAKACSVHLPSLNIILQVTWHLFALSHLSLNSEQFSNFSLLHSIGLYLSILRKMQF